MGHSSSDFAMLTRTDEATGMVRLNRPAALTQAFPVWAVSTGTRVHVHVASRRVEEGRMHAAGLEIEKV